MVHFLDAQSATHCKVKLAGSGGVEEGRIEGGREGREEGRGQGRGKGGVEWDRDGRGRVERGRDGRGRGGRGREVKKGATVNSRVHKIDNYA